MIPNWFAIQGCGGNICSPIQVCSRVLRLLLQMTSSKVSLRPSTGGVGGPGDIFPTMHEGSQGVKMEVVLTGEHYNL